MSCRCLSITSVIAIIIFISSSIITNIFNITNIGMIHVDLNFPPSPSLKVNCQSNSTLLTFHGAIFILDICHNHHKCWLCKNFAKVTFFANLRTFKCRISWPTLRLFNEYDKYYILDKVLFCTTIFLLTFSHRVQQSLKRCM